jgi:molybdopterin/thiamine biosynthesis adenylyltransferase/rhodanese-related sulfurtransferase
MFSQDEINRYAQQIKLTHIGVLGQKKLKKARVLCVGAGGLASPLLLYLAGSGIGTLGIMDGDTVESSNLQRQVLYQHQHLGHKKVEIAEQQIKALNPHVNTITYNQQLNPKNAAGIIAQYDVIADCTDNFSTRYLINDVCFSLDKPFVSASVSEFEGQCTVFLGKRSPCYRCLFPASSIIKALPNCSESGVLGVLPGILGIIQATEVIKLILNIGRGLSGRLLWLDILKTEFREIQYTQNPACELCAQKHVFDSPPKPEAYPMHNEISSQELHQRLTNKEKLLLLDVRTQEERNSYNIGGVFIPLSELPQRLNELETDLEIVTYCRSGGRSLQAVELLKEAGFQSVKSLAGGVTGIQQSQLDFSFLAAL